jgi:hypothetical protein
LGASDTCVARFASALSNAGIDCTGEDIGDIFWLAAQLPVAVTPLSKKKTLTGTSSDAIEEGGEKEVEKASDPTQPPLGKSDSEAPVHLPGRGSSGGTASAGVPIRIPVPPSLDSLGVARALRPLKRPVPSRRRRVLDEKKTADQIAETGIWEPVLQPAESRRLHLVLLVENTTGMGFGDRRSPSYAASSKVPESFERFESGR